MQRALTSSLLGITTLARSRPCCRDATPGRPIPSPPALPLPIPPPKDHRPRGAPSPSRPRRTRPASSTSKAARSASSCARTTAARCYEEAAAKDPSFAMAHYQLAANAATAKDFFAHLKEAVALSAKASEGERLTILALEAGGNAQPPRRSSTSRSWSPSIPTTSGPTSSWPRVLRAAGLREVHRPVPQGHRDQPELLPAYNSLGYAYRAVEKYDDASRRFKKYIELIPGDPNPYDSYAELLMKTGRFDESIAQYQKALSVDEHFTPSRVGIATNLMLQGKPDRGGGEDGRALRPRRDDGDRRTAMFVKGVILTDAGRPTRR